MPPRRSKKPGQQAIEKTKADPKRVAALATSADKENVPNLASALPLDTLTLTTAEASTSAAPSTRTNDTKTSIRKEIKEFLALLTGLNTSSLPLSSEQVNEIGRRLLVLANTQSADISLEDRTDCEVILSLLGSLLEKDVEAGSQRESPPLASSKSFCQAVVTLTSQFFSPQKDLLLFCSHYSFELSLYIVLSIVEKSAITAKFVGNIDKSNLVEFLRSLATMLPRDVFYLTQEMATEAICRIAFFLTTHDKATLEAACEFFPESLRNIILGGKTAILNLLKGMRSFLRDINKDNPNIASFALQSLNGREFRDRKNEGAVWLDLCESFLCIYIGEHDVFVRLKYEQVASSPLKRERDKLTVSLAKGSLPKRFIDVVPVNEQSDFERLEMLFCSQTDTEKAYKFLRVRLSLGDTESKSLLSFEPLIDFKDEPVSAEKTTSVAVQKYSVASTKMMQPWMQPVTPPAAMEEIEEEISVPSHIPAVVRAVSEGESISDLSEDHEEYSFDRQQVRESKRKSITKVDSLVALIAELEKPTKKKEALVPKKTEKIAALETSAELAPAFEEPSWAEEPEERMETTPPRPPSPLKSKTPKTTTSRKIFFGTTKDRSEEKKKPVAKLTEKSPKTAIRRVEPGMRIEPARGLKEDSSASWAGDVEADTSLSSKSSSFAAKRVFGRKKSPISTEPISSKSKERTASPTKRKEEHKEEWKEGVSAEVAQRREESAKKPKPSMTLKTFAPRTAEKPPSTDSEESTGKKMSPTRRFGKQTTTPSLTDRLIDKKEKDKDWEKLVVSAKGKKETVVPKKNGPGRPKKTDAAKKKEQDKKRAEKRKKQEKEGEKEIADSSEEAFMEMPEFEAESFVTPPEAEKVKEKHRETVPKKHTPSPPTKATPRMTSRSIAPSAFSVEPKTKAKEPTLQREEKQEEESKSKELAEGEEEKEFETSRQRTPRRSLPAKTPEKVADVEVEKPITATKRRSSPKEQAKEEVSLPKDENEEAEISFAEEIAGLDRMMLAEVVVEPKEKQAPLRKEATGELTSTRKRRGSEISRAAVTEEEEESTLEESSGPPSKMRARTTTTTREKAVARHQAVHRKTSRDESSWESVAQVSTSSVKRRKTAVEEKENIPLQKKTLKTVFEEEEAEEEEAEEQSPFGTTFRAEVYPEEESFESFAHVSKKSASTAYGESTTDEESVYTLLVNEIVALNQQRSMRRKARQINALQENVTAQLFAYISNSFNALNSATVDIDRDTLAQIDALLVSIEEVSSSVEDYERSIAGREEKLAKATESLMSECSELESAIKLYVQERDSEAKKLQADISRRRRATVESCSQAINGLAHAVKAPKIGKGILHML